MPKVPISPVLESSVIVSYGYDIDFGMQMFCVTDRMLRQYCKFPKPGPVSLSDNVHF